MQNSMAHVKRAKAATLSTWMEPQSAVNIESLVIHAVTCSSQCMSSITALASRYTTGYMADLSSTFFLPQ